MKNSRFLVKIFIVSVFVGVLSNSCSDSDNRSTEISSESISNLEIDTIAALSIDSECCGVDSSFWESLLLSTDVDNTLNDFDTVHIRDMIYYLAEGDLLMSKSQIRAKQVEENRLKIFGKTDPFQRDDLKAQMIRDKVTGDTVKWRKFPLSYAIDRKSFASVVGGYSKARENMIQAIRDWESVCGVKFEYRGNLDGVDGIIPGIDVDFVVSYHFVPKAGAVATSFFPTYDADQRRLIIFPEYWATLYDQVGVLRHEIGHILGFRHEHTVNHSSVFIPSSCKKLGQQEQFSIGLRYDKVSLMHYFCGGGWGTRTLDFSTNDRLAFKKVYPK